MEPMQPMAPMKPMQPLQTWWDESLGRPDSAGAQADLQYAYFEAKKRLLIRQNGTVKAYDTADHRIRGVAQDGDTGHPRFTTEQGQVELSSLRVV